MVRPLGDVAAQCFHTYSTQSGHSAVEVTDLLERGLLLLAPHPPQAIPDEPTWDENPLDDDNWLFQFHSLVWLDSLRIEGLRRGTSALLRRYEETLKDYLVANPRRGGSRRRYSWYDMGVGLRGVVLVCARLTLGDRSWLIDGLESHAAFLADPAEYAGKGNHALHQDMGLIAVASSLGRRDLIDLARNRIAELLPIAIDEEGVCLEGSIGYHLRNLLWYEEAISRLHAAGAEVPEDLELRMAGMPEFLRHATLPDGTSEMIGDTNLSRTPRGKMAPLDPEDPPPLTRVFKAGYVFGRSSWDDGAEEGPSFYSLRFGPGRATAVHGHEDSGSITFYAFRERLLWDSGMYAYEGGPMRVYAISRSSHNVIDVPGAEFYITAEAELLHHEIHDSGDLISVRSRSLRGVDWVRTLFYSRTGHYLIVDDRVNQKTSRPVYQQWNLPVEASPVSLQGEARFHVHGGLDLLFAFAGSGYRPELVKGEEDPPLGWRSTSYRQIEPSPLLRTRLEGTSVRFTTMILPMRTAGQPELLGLRRDSTSAYASLRVGHGLETVSFSAFGLQHHVKEAGRSDLASATSQPRSPTNLAEACVRARSEGDEAAYARLAQEISSVGEAPTAGGRPLKFRATLQGRANVYSAVWIDPEKDSPVFFEKCLRSHDRELRFWRLVAGLSRELEGRNFRVLPPVFSHDTNELCRLVFPYVEHANAGISGAPLDEAVCGLAEFSALATKYFDCEDLAEFGVDPVRSRPKFDYSLADYAEIYPGLNEEERMECVRRGQFLAQYWQVVDHAVSELQHGLCHNDPGPNNILRPSDDNRVLIVDFGNVSRGPLGQDLFIILRHLWRRGDLHEDPVSRVAATYADEFSRHRGVPELSVESVQLAALSAYCIRHTKLLKEHDPHRVHIHAQEMALRLVVDCGGPSFSL